MPPIFSKSKVEFLPTEMKSHRGWCVQVIAPGYPPIQLGGFKTEEEAKEWILRKSEQWLDEHEGEGYV